ncbi:TPA: PTS sugar transporter subunit IIC [Bacillus thuringiensis]|jgi:cellobiose PTS system EIIC component|uniref:Permease IIC component n=4 Tax=Bacillus cereus group TaxID=86661 RepID=A0A9X6KKB4_BACTU|nr:MULTISPECIES: PTS sugar transporter subunit IIC [Bacillus]MDM5375521.1 PTS sugar transporter subunit IIC [Bacillus bombysepticus]AGE78253.1 PTS system, cellobiose-specific IIC component [Bacillus thuringiensis serovar kurstaki str. HD73]AHZ51316.1 PTS system subunit IIC [Bacillus thuringiensis serovar kurstaki str. YBT-1520]AIE33728.1 PTS system subunit IIC [Bacillus thuringiensis serovar kurstaki str. HD-1]AIM31983.1 PTS system, cellobiose-specific IIC component [Bacillus thuringiensis ser
MNKFVTFLDKNLSGPMARLSEQRHLQAIRDGVISALPFIIVGSFFLIVAFPPLPKDSFISVWALKNQTSILIPYRLTMFIMSLYIAFGIGYNLAKSYKLDALSGAQLAVCSLLLTLTPELIDKKGFMLPMTNLGGHGLFVTMIVSILSVEILRFCKKNNVTIKMPEQVPPSVSRSFEALIPAAFVIIMMSLITVVFKVDLHYVVDKLAAPLVKAGDSYFGVIIPVFLITFFWSFGIHGVSVVGTVARPLWDVYLGKNGEAVASGASHFPFIAPEPFYQWFIWIGGSGATLGLVLAMIVFGRSKYSKALSRTCIVPGIFNINEPVIFGLPIVLNPILIIPFVITPLVTATIAYAATAMGFVTPTHIMPPWTLPAPIGAYLATGGDWRAIVLVFINIAISFLIYLPFFKMYDKNMLEIEKNGDGESVNP